MVCISISKSEIIIVKDIRMVTSDVFVVVIMHAKPVGVVALV